jgi:hypothetical protein
VHSFNRHPTRGLVVLTYSMDHRRYVQLLQRDFQWRYSRCGVQCCLPWRLLVSFQANGHFVRE